MHARYGPHLLLHHGADGKAVDLQDPVPDMDGISHLRTNQHPSDSGTTRRRHVRVSICATGGVR